MADFGINSIKKELFCKQIDIANFLTVQRQLIGHVEKNSRTLEMESINTIAALHNSIDARKKANWKAPEIDRLIAKEKSSADEGLDDMLAKTRHLWQKHRLQLDHMKAEYNDRINALHQLHFMKVKEDFWTDDQKSWIDKQIATNKDKIAGCGIKAQRDLELQVAMFSAKIEELNKIIGNKFDILLETLNVLDGMQAPPIGKSSKKNASNSEHSAAPKSRASKN